MSFDPNSRRFNPRRLFPAVEIDSHVAPHSPDLSPFSLDIEYTSSLTEQDFDDALEQVVAERCCVCPLCGRNRDTRWVRGELRTVRRGPSGPREKGSSSRSDTASGAEETVFDDRRAVAPERNCPAILHSMTGTIQ